MLFSRNKYESISNFELKRLNFWKFLSRNINKYGEMVDTPKFKTKEQFYIYIKNKFGYSKSQTKRLIKQFNLSLNNETCIRFVKHKNSFLEPYNKFSKAKMDQIVNNYKTFYNTSKSMNKYGHEVYIPFTLMDYYYLNKKDYSYDTLRRILISNNICSSFSYRGTKKKIKQNLLNQNIKDNKTIEMINQCLNYKLSKHSKAIRKQRIMGQVVEIDGCIHEWIPEIGKCNILAIVDAGTGVLLSASLDWQETNKAYIEAIIKLVNKYGLPQAIYGDRRRSIFSDGINTTKITRPLNELGVVVKCESFPEHKPNVESMWKVLQQSLPILLHQRKIKTYKQFESFVNNELCDWYNKRFRKYISPLNRFRYIEPEVFKNNFVVSVTRRIRKGNYLKVDDRCVAPFNNQNQRMAMKENGSINVYWNLTSQNKPYIKCGSEKCYLKDIDPLVESFNPKELDPWTPLDENEEIIINLKDQICNLQEEIANLKLKCIANNINI